MTIHIPISDLNPAVRELYLGDRLQGGLTIDYAPNCLMSWYEGKEVVVFDFTRVCKMDNRWSSYEIHKNKTEIIIEISW